MPLKKSVLNLVDEATAAITTVSTAEALTHHKTNAEDVVFVDVRDVRELQRDGLIPGAFHCPRGMLEFWADPESPYHKEVFSSGKKLIFYCAAAWRSALSTKTLVDMGLDNVAQLEGGLNAWKDAGGPVEKREGDKG